MGLVLRCLIPVVARWTSVDPLADMSQQVSPYTFCVDNPITFTDKFGLDTGKVRVLKEVEIYATKILKQSLDVSLYFSRPMGTRRFLFWKPKRIDKAENFDDMAYNAIVNYSSKTIVTGELLNKLKNDPAFQAWRKKILAQYKANPLIKRYAQVIKFGGQKFFSTDGDTESKLSIRNAPVIATFDESNGTITINYQLNDSFDLDYQAGRGAVYNGINGVLKPIWVGILDGRPDMKVEGDWSETLKQ
jgi:hypothetical protein